MQSTKHGFIIIYCEAFVELDTIILIVVSLISMFLLIKSDIKLLSILSCILLILHYGIIDLNNNVLQVLCEIRVLKEGKVHKSEKRQNNVKPLLYRGLNRFQNQVILAGMRWSFG